MNQTITKVQRPTFKSQTKVFFMGAIILGMVLPLISWMNTLAWDFRGVLIPAKFYILELGVLIISILLAFSIFLLKRNKFTIESSIALALFLFAFSWFLNSYVVWTYLRVLC